MTGWGAHRGYSTYSLRSLSLALKTGSKTGSLQTASRTIPGKITAG